MLTHHHDLEDSPRDYDPSLPAQILSNSLFDRWLTRAYELLGSGASAGSGYPEFWIRDAATFIDLALDVVDPSLYRDAFDVFFHFQEPDGGIVDGFARRESYIHPYRFIENTHFPNLYAHKNTVSVDQESSLLLAVRSYVVKTGDVAFLLKEIGDRSVFDRLENALEFVLQHRWSDRYELVWNATTIDWGDIQPEHSWGVEMDENTHRAISIYPNAMFVRAIDAFSQLAGLVDREPSSWVRTREMLADSIRRHLWDERRTKYRPHIYLDGSPFPDDFNEEPIFFHGGTAVAMQAGLPHEDEVPRLLAKMRENREEAGAQSLGLTIWPLYNIPNAENPCYRRPFFYQNGGDWPWFGGRVPHGLLNYGLVQDAYDELIPILEITDRADDFVEWFSPAGEPRGATGFRGAAGVLGSAIRRLQNWAERFEHRA